MSLWEMEDIHSFPAKKISVYFWAQLKLEYEQKNKRVNENCSHKVKKLFKGCEKYMGQIFLGIYQEITGKQRDHIPAINPSIHPDPLFFL